MFRWWNHHTVHSYVLMTRTISMVQHLFKQREWTDRQGRRIRQPRQWVVQTFPSRRGPVLHFSSLPSPRPSIKQHWWILCRCGRCFNAAWNCLVFQTTPSVRLSRHLYLFLNVTQTTRDQPLRLDLQQEPSLQRGSSILRRVLSVLLSDGPRRPTDRPGLPWVSPQLQCSIGHGFQESIFGGRGCWGRREEDFGCAIWYLQASGHFFQGNIQDQPCQD